MQKTITTTSAEIAQAIQAGVNVALQMLQVENREAVSTASPRKGKQLKNQQAIDQVLERRRKRFGK